jgi:hypothetical protein
MGYPNQFDILRGLWKQLSTHTVQGYWAVVPVGLELIAVKAARGMDNFMSPQRKGYATDLCTKLNREIAFDGKWIVAFCELDLAIGLFRHLAMLFADQDGDVQFVVDSDESFETQVRGVDAYVQQCAEAHAAWREMIRDVDVSPQQRIMAAQGEGSADLRAMPDVTPFQ